MKVRKPYENQPIGFSEGVTNTEIGPIYDLYYVSYKNPDGTSDSAEKYIPIGRIGKMTGFGPTIFYATPILYSPFTNTARRFSTRKEAAIYLLGLYDAQQSWLEEMKRNPKPGNIGMRHMF